MSKKISILALENIPIGIICYELEFNKVLSKRILLGEEIYERLIETPDDLIKNKEDYTKWNDYNSEYLKSAFNIANNEYTKSYNDTISSFFSSLSIRNSNIQDEKNFKDKVSNKISTLKKIRSETEQMKTNYVKSSIFNKYQKQPLNFQLYIVPGEDKNTLIKAVNFIENLGLEVIILNNQTSLVKKIEQNPEVKFAIILKTWNQHPKEKQNIIFEHWYLIGKLCIENICVLVKENVEVPKDILGIVYVPMDETDLWCYGIGRELKKAGFSIDMKKYNYA